MSVDQWTIRIFRASPFGEALFAAALGWFGWTIGVGWWALGLAALFFVVALLQNRYIVVDAELGEVLRLRYLGGRERTIQPSAVKLCQRSPWRACFYGGFPVVPRHGWGCVGGFYPTLRWEDLDALDRWLNAANNESTA